MGSGRLGRRQERWGKGEGGGILPSVEIMLFREGLRVGETGTGGSVWRRFCCGVEVARRIAGACCGHGELEMDVVGFAIMTSLSCVQCGRIVDVRCVEVLFVMKVA